jgi:hypothetical protein
MGTTRDIVRRTSIAGWVIGVAGLVALVTISLVFQVGELTGTVYSLALLLMTAAIPFLMLAFWELGGVTPTPLAVVAQALGWLACATWCVIHLLFVSGAVSIDDTAPTTGAYAVQAVALAVIGAWIAGANLLAGPWLTGPRWFGFATGTDVVMYAIGSIVSGSERTFVLISGVAYLVLLPIWALLMGWFLGRLARSAE